MNGNKRPFSYYFDACVYLAYLRNEVKSYGPQRISAIGSIWKECERGGICIVTSAISLTEVLSHKLDVKSEKLFRQVTESGLHICLDVEPTIALKAREMRDYYHANPVRSPSGSIPRKHLTTPDALHLATAVIYECSEFLTFDGFSATKKDNTIGLLWLGNKAGKDDLVITMPSEKQGTFPFPS